MKKVFIYTYNLELGGIERSLIGLLESFNEKEYSVDLFLAKQEGDLLSDIPDNVNLLPVDRRYQAFGIPAKEAIKQGFVYEVLMRTFAKIANNILRRIKRDKTIAIESFIYHKLIISRMKKQSKEYDLAISFAMPYFYVLDKVRANVKIGFIHTDYSRVNIDFGFIRKMFDHIDYIASVSESVRNSLLNNVSVDKNKTLVVENIMPMKSIKNLADESIDDMPDDGSIRILSIGRFGEAKNFDNVPYICRAIVESGLDVKWYLIGFGKGEELIRQRIKETEMEKRVVILGKKTNPYPYIAACDLYVQPSRYEGKAVTVREAQMFYKPVVITDFPTSKDQVINGYDGIIVPLANDLCAASIVSLFNNPELLNRLRENCKANDYTNSKEICKLYELL